jgi:GPH family glycoside/pentoside/hexuronide:cation symporter
MPSSPPLPRSIAITYSLPSAGVGFALFMGSIFFFKYATDVLGITAAAMGWILFASRFWDAVSDPVVGFLTDRTRTRLGRRRPWMIGSALPLGLIIVALWSPPSFLSSDALVYWVAAAYMLLYTASTAFGVPYDALGAELTNDYHSRNMLFGFRRALFGAGAFLALAGVALMTQTDLTTELGRLETREIALWVAGASAILTTALTLFTAARIRERPDYLDRGGHDVLRSVRDVWRNVPARLLLLVNVLQQFGTGCVTLMAPFYIDYVLEAPDQIATILVAFMSCTFVSIPVWVAAARRFEKKTVLIVAMSVISVTMVPGFFFEPGDLLLALVFVSFAGLAAGASDVLFPSLQADVIDVDEHRTGERKEGTYFAVWAFASKTSMSLVGVVVGIWAIRILWCGLPILFWTAGILLFLRFRLTAAEHARIRAEIDTRTTLT